MSIFKELENEIKTLIENLNIPFDQTYGFHIQCKCNISIYCSIRSSYLAINFAKHSSDKFTNINFRQCYSHNRITEIAKEYIESNFDKINNEFISYNKELKNFQKNKRNKK